MCCTVGATPVYEYSQPIQPSISQLTIRPYKANSVHFLVRKVDYNYSIAPILSLSFLFFQTSLLFLVATFFFF